MYEKICEECGKGFLANRKHGKYCCEECRREGNRRKVRESSRIYYAQKKMSKTKKIDTGKMGLAEIGKKAREEGLSYGEYVFKHGL